MIFVTLYLLGFLIFADYVNSMSYLKTQTGVELFIGIFLLGAVFTVDLLTPLGVADGMSYVVIVLLTIWSESRRQTITVSVISIILVIIGYYLSPLNSEMQNIAIANRFLSVLCIISAAVIVSKYKNVEIVVEKQRDSLIQMTKELNQTNVFLEEQVKARTMILEEAILEIENSKNELTVALEHEKELGALKTRIVSMASHEFRTPLATILSSVSLITKYAETNEKEKQFKHIVKIKSAISHLTDLLEDTLSVSKLEEGKIVFKPEEININTFISDFILEIQPLAKAGQVINYMHQGINEMVGDRKILKRILMNLTSNAIKFSNEKSEINIYSFLENETLLLKVKDNGIGISESDQLHLFERFFRAENAFNIQGTGLGLCIVAKYVEYLNGTLEVISKLNQGSEFTVKIPIVLDIKSQEAEGTEVVII